MLFVVIVGQMLLVQASGKSYFEFVSNIKNAI